MDCSLPGSSVNEIFQARILEWAAISFSRGSSQPRDRTQVSCIVGRRFTVWATREAFDFYSHNLNVSCFKGYTLDNLGKGEVLMLSRLFATPRTAAHQAPLSMQFSRQEYWSGLPFPTPGDLLHQGIKSESSVSPALADRDSLPLSHQGSHCSKYCTCSNLVNPYKADTISVF